MFQGNLKCVCGRFIVVFRVIWEISRNFKIASRKFEGNFKCVSRLVEKCFTCISRMVHECLKGDARCLRCASEVLKRKF